MSDSNFKALVQKFGAAMFAGGWDDESRTLYEQIVEAFEARGYEIADLASR